MKLTFSDYQDSTNPLNGTQVESPAELRELFKALYHREPFGAELLGENGFRLTIWLGGPKGGLQHGREDGAPPYLVPVATDDSDSSDDYEFMVGGTSTPISARYVLPIDEVIEICVVFMETGQRKGDMVWEEI